MKPNKPGEFADGLIDIEEIMRRIPHRPPFLMVDRAEGFQSGKSLVGIKCVSANEPYLQGRSPGELTFPGVMLIEVLAQTGGLLMSKTWDEDSEGKIILFISVDKCRFRHPVRPGDVVRSEVEVVRTRSRIAKLRGRAMVGRKLAAEAEVAALMVGEGAVGGMSPPYCNTVTNGFQLTNGI